MRLWILASLAFFACKKDESIPPPAPEPGELRVGVSRVRMPAPVGIGTVGNFGVGGSFEPSPFADIYPATTRVHNHLDFRAVAVSRGPGFEAIFVRSDTIGIFEHFRRAVVLELADRVGRDLDDALVIGATHTHSGPGRLVDGGGPYDLIADKFLPEHYERMVLALADAVELALDDLAPGRIGWTVTRNDDGVSDRRCEDGVDYVNGQLPVLAVEQEGQLAALVLSYPVHGTVLGIDELTLSQDVSGGIEQAVEDTFDHPVQVQMQNSWGADMAPGRPAVPLQDGASLPDGYGQMEEVGAAVAESVRGAIGDVQWEEAPVIALSTHRFEMSRDAIGYAADEFNYPNGGIFCGSGIEPDCDLGPAVQEGIDGMCVPLPDDFPAPPVTEFTAGRVGAMHLVTFPGEAGTLLAEQILAEAGAIDGVEDVMFVGYAQDYTGYSILEDDWWFGGYEAGGALWGPRQGAYLAENALLAFRRAVGADSAVDEPAPVEPFVIGAYDPYQGPDPVGFGAVLSDVDPTASGAQAVVEFTVAGDDPWWGVPIAWLEQADGTPVLRPNGAPLGSDGQAFWVDLDVDPLYSDGLDQPERAFAWTFHLPLVHPVATAGPQLTPGSYRLRVELPRGADASIEVVSSAFAWEG